MFEKMTIEQFDEILASKSATPGGGSALAIVGAMACALVEMSVNVTLKKGESEDMCSIIRENLPFFSHARKRLNKLADDDAEAFGRIVECMKLPRNNDAEIAHRNAELQKAYHRAALVPLDVMGICAECLKRAKNKVYPYLYDYVSSDCKVGMDLFGNIIENSMENVRANTALIADKQLALRLEKQGEEIGKNS